MYKFISTLLHNFTFMQMRNHMYMLFYKIKFSFLCTPLIRLLKKFFTKLNFHTCVPIDKTTQKNLYKIKFSFLCTPLICESKIIIFLNLKSLVIRLGSPLSYYNCFLPYFARICRICRICGRICRILCDRCVCGFWRQMPVYTLLTLDVDNIDRFPRNNASR